MSITSDELWKRLGKLYDTAPDTWPLVELVLRMAMELDALRTTLSDPRVPDVVRDAYRDGYAACSVRFHNAAGAHGGWEKTLRQFFPRQASADDPIEDMGELEMLQRLGMSESDRARHQERLREVETYT